MRYGSLQHSQTAKPWAPFQAAMVQYSIRPSYPTKCCNHILVLLFQSFDAPERSAVIAGHSAFARPLAGPVALNGAFGTSAHCQSSGAMRTAVIPRVTDWDLLDALWCTPHRPLATHCDAHSRKTLRLPYHDISHISLWS